MIELLAIVFGICLLGVQWVILSFLWTGTINPRVDTIPRRILVVITMTGLLWSPMLFTLAFGMPSGEPRIDLYTRACDVIEVIHSPRARTLRTQGFSVGYHTMPEPDDCWVIEKSVRPVCQLDLRVDEPGLVINGLVCDQGSVPGLEVPQ